MSKELERRQLREAGRGSQWRRRHASDRRLCVEIQQAVPQSGRLGGTDRTRVAEQVRGRWLARRDGPLQPRTSARQHRRGVATARYRRHRPRLRG